MSSSLAYQKNKNKIKIQLQPSKHLSLVRTYSLKKFRLPMHIFFYGLNLKEKPS